MDRWPALDVRSDAGDLIQAIVDDFGPTAIEDRDRAVRVFFASVAARDSARTALSARFDVVPIDVPDDDWARRSQQNLTPITVGRLTIVPHSKFLIPHSEFVVPGSYALVIPPSMGFGTGHHATTRLCLAALQTIDLDGGFALDVGTGSGVLALAAVRLGAARAVGIDTDPDAIQSARENLTLNSDVRHVAFEIADLTSAALPQADVVTANLTGALLVRAAAELQRTLPPGGSLIVSGLLTEERAAVRAAFNDLAVIREADEDGWAAIAFRLPQ